MLYHFSFFNVRKYSPHCTPPTPGRFELKCQTSYSTCHAQSNDRVFFLPRIPNHKAKGRTAWIHMTSGPGCSRHMAEVCIWVNMHRAVEFHTGQQWLTSTDEGFYIQTCQRTGWGSQSSVEHCCCQRLLLHAHNCQIASRLQKRNILLQKEIYMKFLHTGTYRQFLN